MDFGPRFAGVAAAMVVSIGFPCSGQESPVASPEIKTTRSVSSSGQFLVYGDNPTDRAVLCRYADDLREGLAKVLKTEGDWEFPIVIQIHTRPPSTVAHRHVSGSVRPTDRGFRFQIDVLLADGFFDEALKEEILRLLILERMLGGNPANREPVRENRLLPRWLHLGIVELVRYRQEGAPNEVYESILASGRILPIEEVIGGDSNSTNSVSRVVFGASAAALVRALLRMESGPQRLRAFLEGLPQHRGDELTLLRRVYPDLAGSKTSLEKWWALEVVAMGRPGAADFLDPEMTQERLQEALTVRYREPSEDEKNKKKRKGKSEAPPSGEEKVCHLSDYKQLLELEDGYRRTVLSRNQALLMKLGHEAFPLYRAVVGDYQRLLGAVILGKGRGLEERFKNIEESTYLLGQQLRNLEDYMNWYEATQQEGKSGTFDDYRRAVEELRRDAPPREDGISKYLDRWEGRLDK